MPEEWVITEPRQINAIEGKRSLSTIFLDGIRGLAALEVVAGHACMLLYANYRYGYLPHRALFSPFQRTVLYASRLLLFGNVAVIIFFVLSGFVIHLRYARKLQSGFDTSNFGWRSFFFRRARRIYPPLLLAILITYLFDTWGARLGFSIYRQATGDPYLTQVVPPLSHSFKTLLGNLAFLTNSFVPSWGSNDPLWSLMYEWWFYMLYPLYWPLLRRSLFGATGVVVMLYAVSFLPLAATFGPAGLLFQNVFRGMLIWWLGVLLAEMHSGRLPRAFGRIAPLAVLVPILAVLQLAHKPFPEILSGLGCAGVIALGFWWQQIGRSVGLLEHLKRLGDMSYTLYIIHFPVFVFASGWLLSTSPTGELPRTIGWALLGIAGMLPLAFLAHFLVEKPFVGRHRPDQQPVLMMRAEAPLPVESREAEILSHEDR